MTRQSRSRLLIVPLAILLAVTGLNWSVPTARAATLPDGFREILVASSLAKPTAMAVAPDGRVFICEQTGAVRVVKSGTLLTTPFIQFSVDATGERGLLGIAFDPAFASNKFVYFYYTTKFAPKRNIVVRVTADGDVAAPDSRLVIWRLNPLSTARNHNGGAIHFGPDGKLYIAVGENANPDNAQSLDTMLGKLLRINSDGSIPTDNPFYNIASGNNRAIWALGLRNPFTFAFQRGTGRLFINDVGFHTWEEINDGLKGANYGWPTTEGETNNPSFESPLFAYAHGSGLTQGCAIAGGAFYNPTTLNFPSQYVGDYFFADLCSGWIRHYDLATDAANDFASGASHPVDLLVVPNGSLYYLARGTGTATGTLHRVRYIGP